MTAGRELQGIFGQLARSFSRRRERVWVQLRLVLKIDMLAARHYSGFGSGKGAWIALLPPNSGLSMRAFSGNTSGRAYECPIADAKIRGAQENARRKQIRSKGERLLQIAVLHRSREFPVSSVYFLSHRCRNQRVSSCGSCSTNSYSARGWSRNSGLRP